MAGEFRRFAPKYSITATEDARIQRSEANDYVVEGYGPLNSVNTGPSLGAMWKTTRLGRFDCLFYNHSCGGGLFDNFMSSGNPATDPYVIDESRWEIQGGVWSQSGGYLETKSDDALIRFRYPYPLLSGYATADSEYVSDTNQYMLGLFTLGTLGQSGVFGLAMGDYIFQLYRGYATLTSQVKIYKAGTLLEERLVSDSNVGGKDDKMDIYFYMDRDMIGFYYTPYNAYPPVYNGYIRNEYGVNVAPEFAIRRSTDTCDGYVKFFVDTSWDKGVFLKNFYFVKPTFDNAPKCGMLFEKTNSMPNFLRVEFDDWRERYCPTKHGIDTIKTVMHEPVFVNDTPVWQWQLVTDPDGIHVHSEQVVIYSGYYQYGMDYEINYYWKGSYHTLIGTTTGPDLLRFILTSDPLWYKSGQYGVFIRDTELVFLDYIQSYDPYISYRYDGQQLEDIELVNYSLGVVDAWVYGVGGIGKQIKTTSSSVRNTNGYKLGNLNYRVPSDQSRTIDIPLPKRRSEDGRGIVASKMLNYPYKNNRINGDGSYLGNLSADFYATISNITITGILCPNYVYNNIVYGTQSGYHDIYYNYLNFDGTRGLITTPELTFNMGECTVGTFNYCIDGKLYTMPETVYNVIEYEPYYSGNPHVFYNLAIYISGDRLIFTQSPYTDNEHASQHGSQFTNDINFLFNSLVYAIRLEEYPPYVGMMPAGLYGTRDYMVLGYTKVGVSEPDYRYNIKPVPHIIAPYYLGTDGASAFFGRPTFSYKYSIKDDYKLAVIAPGISGGISPYLTTNNSKVYRSAESNYIRVNGDWFEKQYDETLLPDESGYFYVGYNEMGGLAYDKYGPLALSLGQIVRSPPCVDYWYNAWEPSGYPPRIHFSGCGFLCVDDSELIYGNNTVILKPKYAHGGFDICDFSQLHPHTIRDSITLSSGTGFYYYIKYDQDALHVKPYDDLWDSHNMGISGNILVCHVDNDVLIDDRGWYSYGGSGLVSLGRDIYYGQEGQTIHIIPDKNLYYVRDASVYKIAAAEIELPRCVCRGLTDVDTRFGYSSTEDGENVLYP